MRRVLLAACLAMTAALTHAASMPQPSFMFDVTDAAGSTETDLTSFEGSAPVTATFTATVNYDGACELIGEWRKWPQGGSMNSPELVRRENPTEITFTSATTDSVAFYGYILYNVGDTLFLNEEYWWQETNPLTVRTFESSLTMPNAFSPNGDGINDVYKAKQYQSIIEFNAKIFNRWGQKLYEWNNVAEGWDGTFNGKPVKDGAYYVQVRAKGSDGQVFNIEKDVNILRSYIKD